MLPSNESVDAYIDGMQYGSMLRVMAKCGHILDDIEQIEDPLMRLRLNAQIAVNPIPEQLAAIRERAAREAFKILGRRAVRGRDRFRPPTRKQQLARLAKKRALQIVDGARL